jgi:hypothetical protein
MFCGDPFWRSSFGIGFSITATSQTDQYNHRPKRQDNGPFGRGKAT